MFKIYKSLLSITAIVKGLVVISFKDSITIKYLKDLFFLQLVGENTIFLPLIKKYIKKSEYYL